MIRRLVLALYVSFFMMNSIAVTDHDDQAQTVFELERSVAILQLSKANLEDYKVMSEKMSSLENRADFFAVLTFLLCIGLVALFVQFRHQQKRLLAFEQIKKDEVAEKE